MDRSDSKRISRIVGPCWGDHIINPGDPRHPIFIVKIWMRVIDSPINDCDDDRDDDGNFDGDKDDDNDDRDGDDD